MFIASDLCHNRNASQQTQSSSANLKEISSKEARDFLPFPRELKIIICRLAFSTLFNVNNHDQGYLKTEDDSCALYHQITDLAVAISLVPDSLMQANREMLKNVLLERIRTHYENVPLFKTASPLLKGVYPYVFLPANDCSPILQFDVIMKSSQNFGTKLKELSNVKMLMTVESGMEELPVPCLLFLRNIDTAQLMLSVTTESYIKNAVVWCEEFVNKKLSETAHKAGADPIVSFNARCTTCCMLPKICEASNR